MKVRNFRIGRNLLFLSNVWEKSPKRVKEIYRCKNNFQLPKKKGSWKIYLFHFFCVFSTMVKKLGTHSGRFHTDEILAVVMLKCLPEYKDAEIVRTRDNARLDKCDVVVDVGGVYDHSKKRYDHHQKEFNDNLDEKHSIRLSSAGLIYKHYGKEVLEKGFGITDKVKRNAIYDALYTKFIEAVDAVDNGVSQYEGPTKYEVNTTLQNRVNALNPNFLEEDVDENERFKKAMELVKTEFFERVHYLRDVWWVAREIVERAVAKRFECHKSGRVIHLETNCPYWDHLYEIEKNLNIEGQILYVLYFDRYKNYRCGAVEKEKESFSLRLPLWSKCRGLKDEALEKASNIKGLTFVHYSGFTSGGKDMNCLIQLIEETLKENMIVW